MPTAGWWEALWPTPYEIVTAVGISPDMEIVDLCSGDGWFTLQIANRAHYVVAIDIEPKLLETARHRLAENNVTNCSFVTGNAYDLLKLLGHPADFVFMANVFHGVPDKPRCVSRSLRRAQAGRSLRHCQLASAATRADNRAGRAAGAANRTANDSGRYDCSGHTSPIRSVEGC
jgi:SAM-dependent methyltransferase